MQTNTSEMGDQGAKGISFPLQTNTSEMGKKGAKGVSFPHRDHLALPCHSAA